MDGGVSGCECMECPMQVHMYMHACMHTRMHMHVKHDKHGCLHGGGHLQLLYMQRMEIIQFCLKIWDP